LSLADAMARPRPRILVVEDEPGTRQALEMLLDLEGYAVSVATNGRQGLDALAGNEFDLVITDHMMPLMDGLVFLSRVRGDPRLERLPVIMLSASPRPPEAMVALMDAFVAKPFEIPALLGLIERLLPVR
jgi:CheY-like chemotaxis protein